MGIFRALLGICNSPKLDESLWTYTDDEIILEESAFDNCNVVGVYLKGQGLASPVLLYRGDDQVLRAAKNVCPHAKRKLDPLPGSSKLRCCSINHSTFDYEGNKLSGPATGNLTIYPVKVENGIIRIAVK